MARTESLDSGTSRALSPARGRLVVTATDSTGKPVADADVWILDIDGLDRIEATLAGRMTGDLIATSRSLATHVQTTDSMGRATFHRSDAKGVLIAAERGPLFGQKEIAHSNSDELPSDITVRLAERRVFEVAVSHPSGEPAVGIPVSAGVRTPIPGSVDGRTRSDLLPVTARTDEAGRATLYLPREFRMGELFARARVATERHQVSELVSGSETAIVLPASGTLLCRVVDDEDGAPITGGYVQLFARRDGSVSDATLVRPIENGSVRFNAVEAGIVLSATLVLPTESGYGRAKVRVGAIELGTTTSTTIEVSTKDLEPVTRTPGSS